MKSKRAEEFINNSSELIDGLEWMIDTSTARRAVELAEGDAEEEIEALKAIAVEAFKRCCIYRSKSEDSDSCFLNDQYNTCDNNCSKVKLLIQRLNEQ